MYILHISHQKRRLFKDSTRLPLLPLQQSINKCNTLIFKCHLLWPCCTAYCLLLFMHNSIHLKCPPSFIRRQESSLNWQHGAVTWWREVIWTTTSTGSKANSVHRYANQYLAAKIFHNIWKSICLNIWITEVISFTSVTFTLSVLLDDRKVLYCEPETSVLICDLLYICLVCLFFTFKTATFSVICD